MPTARDAPAIADLLRSQGLDPEELQLARLVRFDPRRRLVVCATALIDSREQMLGVGAIELDADPPGRPNFLVTDEEQAGGLDTLLEQALVGRAAVLARSHAA
jgi:hypothetical protein